MPVASGSIAYLGAARFQGFWNASTNEATGSGASGLQTYSWSSGVVNELFATGSSTTPGGYAKVGVVEASGNGLTASAGDYWQVTGSGTHNVDGTTNWNLNDWIIYSGSAGSSAAGTWKRLAFEDTIASVIMGDLSASDVFHLAGSNDKHVLFVSGTSDHTVNMSGSNNLIIDYNTGSASNRMRVGIGGATGYGSTNVLNPMNVLQVSHTGADRDDGILIVRNDSSTVDGDLLGGIGFDSTDGNVPSSVAEASAFIAAYAAEDHGTGDKGADLVFGTSKINDDDDTASTEHVRISDSGLVGIGTSNPGTLLHVSGTHTEFMIDTAIGVVISSSVQNSGQAVLRIKNNADYGATGGGHYISGESAISGKDSFRLMQQNDGAGKLRIHDASGSIALSFVGGGPGADGGSIYIMNKGNPSDYGVLYFDGSQKPSGADEFLHLSGSDQGLALSGTSVVVDGRLQGSDVGGSAAAGVRQPLLLSEISGTSAYFNSNAFVFGDLGVTGSLSLASALVLDDHLSGSTAYFNSNAFVFGDLGVTGSVTTTGAISGSSTLNIVGASNFGPGNDVSISATGVVSGSGASTIHIFRSDRLTAGTADINGGSIDNATIGATTPSSIEATTISGSSTLHVAGASTFGPANYASISAAGAISGSGDSTIHKVTVDQLVASTVDINGGNIDATAIGAASGGQSTIKATSISGSSTLHIAGASTFGPANYASISAAGAISGSLLTTLGGLLVNGALGSPTPFSVTSLGHLSGTSAYIKENAFLFGDLGVTGSATVAGDITVGDKVIHKDDADTYMDFNNNSLDFIMGGLHSTTISTAAVMTNVNRYDIDFNHWVTGTVGSWPSLHSDAALGRVGVGTNTPGAKLDVSGSTKLGRNDGMTSTHQITGSVYLTDNSKFVFGENDDAHIEYNEDGDDYLIISGSTNGVVISGSNVVIDGMLQGASPLVISGSEASASLIISGTCEVTGALSVSGSTIYNYGDYYNYRPNKILQFHIDSSDQRVIVHDDQKLTFGSHNDAHIEYNENGDDYLVISGSNKGIVLSGSNIVIDGLLQGASPLQLGDVNLTGDLTVSGHYSGSTSYVSSNSFVYGNLEITGSVTTTGAISGSSTLNVEGVSNFGPGNLTSINAAGAISGSGDSTIHKITMNQLVAATADINGGSIDSATLGANTPSSVKATTISGSSTLHIAGASTFGPADYASISAAGIISGSGDSTIHKVTMNQLVAATADINGGAIDGTTLGASIPSSVKATTLSGSDNLNVVGVSTFGAANYASISSAGVISGSSAATIHKVTMNQLHVKGAAIVGTLTAPSMNSSGQTIPAAALLNGTWTAMNRGAGQTDTTDTAANIVSAISNCSPGDAFEFLYMNVSPNAVTLAGGTEVTMMNSATASYAIGAGEGRAFKIMVKNIGSGAQAVTMVPTAAAFNLNS